MIDDLFIYSGQNPFGCWHCGGMGYQDYPSNKMPCPVEGHQKRAEQNLQDVMRVMEARKKNYRSEMGKCPYCLAQGREIGIECEHWSGDGWARDRKIAFRKGN